MVHPASESDGNTFEDDSKHEDIPACHSCRRKKAKCSRTQPCSHCAKQNVECVYDGKKTRPGMRTGALEHLNQRVATLENMFLGQGLLFQELCSQLSQAGAPLVASSHSSPAELLQSRTARLKESLLERNHTERNHTEPSSSDLKEYNRPPPAKRQKVDDGPFEIGLDTALNLDDGHVHLPDDLVDSLTDIYFARIHPWTPMLHEARFRARMKKPSERAPLRMICYAIVSLCARLSDDHRLLDANVCLSLSKRCRQVVMLKGMESFSVENLQALVICAFDIMGTGRGPSAWSIVGSMARTVEYLQLSVEQDGDEQLSENFQVLIKRAAFLRRSQDWTEVESRRRVFWNIFLMDRFCSIATGWNISLKSEEIKRRLPCEGKLWNKAEPPPNKTPFLGVSNMSTETSESTMSASSGEDSMELLGGFAYCVEATENLSLVTSFFLMQGLDTANMHAVQHWLLRFKKLDLRLIQWKLFLPERWKEACALNEDGIMDPNLTLAHITHNTAVVLLHQCIAYPATSWQTMPMKLPSISSAETCLAASREVAIIAQNFLQGGDFLTNPQFSFCLFICGRLLLAHSGYYKVELSPSFDSLIHSLQEISRRWNGPRALEISQASNLASKFTQRLLKARALGATALDIRQSAIPGDAIQATRPTTPQPIDRAPGDSSPPNGPPIGFPTQPVDGIGNVYSKQEIQGSVIFHGNVEEQYASPDDMSLAFPPLPTAFQSTSMFTDPMQALGFQAWQQVPNELHPSFPPGVENLEAIDPFSSQSFLPSERISVYSDLQAHESLNSHD
ncbi:fungal-specific transcription factor domain-containing protein [Xylaria arbuscula]|nr:fungal-specific transcription factor domain-containing protein [Xylaria arbuscula]